MSVRRLFSFFCLCFLRDHADLPFLRPLDMFAMCVLSYLSLCRDRKLTSHTRQGRFDRHRNLRLDRFRFDQRWSSWSPPRLHLVDERYLCHCHVSDGTGLPVAYRHRFLSQRFSLYVLPFAHPRLPFACPSSLLTSSSCLLADIDESWGFALGWCFWANEIAVTVRFLHPPKNLAPSNLIFVCPYIL
jgi:hypothetical protein